MSDSSPTAADTPSADVELLGNTPAADTATADSGTQDGKPDSSPAPAGTMLDAVQAALEPKVASPAPKEPGQAEEADPNAKTAEGEKAESEELSADELKALSWKSQQRFKSLNDRVKAKDAELTALKPKAESYDRMVGAIKSAGLESAEVDELVELGGLLKSNPREARDRLVPIVNALDKLLGEVLPPELQERVRLGYISEEDARQLQRSQADARLNSKRAETLEAGQRAEREAAQQKQLFDSSVQAVESWDKRKAEKDPDWHLKREEIAEQVKLAIVDEQNKRGKPYFPTAEEAVKFAEDALKKIDGRIARFKPKPAEIRPTTPGASTRSKPAPKTILDAVNNAL